MKPIARSRKHTARDKNITTLFIFIFIKLSNRAKSTTQTSASRARFIAGLRYMCGLRRNDFSDGSQRNSDFLPEVGIAPRIGGASKS
jgi:hypothetical protein